MIVPIHISNVVWSKVPPQHVDLIAPCITYGQIQWRWSQAAGKKIRKEIATPMINMHGRFSTGLVSRVCKYLDQKKQQYRLTDNSEVREPDNEPYIPVIPGVFTKFYDHQIELILAAIAARRGVIVAATGSGKTGAAAGIISCYNDARWLFIVDKKTLARQAMEAFSNYQFQGINLCYEGSKDISGDLVIATRQSLAEIDLESAAYSFDGIIVDEVHHTPDAYAQNLEILTKLYSPLRFGLTGSYPSDLQQQLAIEAAIGPIVGEFSVEEAIAKGVISKPIMRLEKTDFHENIRLLKRWRDVEYRGIVTNLARNRQIMRIAHAYVREGKSVLILINQIEHGENLMRISEQIGAGAAFIHGATEVEHREQMRRAFHRKDIKCIIASTIWKEGVDIPSLDVVVNAGGGKSEIGLLQKIGRGFRRTGDKDTFIFVDFFDPSHPLLVAHFGERCTFFFEMGWMN